MSVRYHVYAEIKVGDRWYNLNPLMKKHDGTLVVRPIYDNGSFFFDICNDLEDHRIGVGIPDDMSPELRNVFHENLDETCEGWNDDTTWRKEYERAVFCVRYSDTIVKRIIKEKEYKYEGYVRKRTVADFEINEIEEIDNWLTYDEYQSLSDKQKRAYQFYRWDEPYDEYGVYRIIYERLRAMLYWFDFADAFEDKSVYWHSGAGFSDVRLFIERS